MRQHGRTVNDSPFRLRGSCRIMVIMRQHVGVSKRPAPFLRSKAFFLSIPLIIQNGLSAHFYVYGPVDSRLRNHVDFACSGINAVNASRAADRCNAGRAADINILIKNLFFLAAEAELRCRMNSVQTASCHLHGRIRNGNLCDVCVIPASCHDIQLSGLPDHFLFRIERPDLINVDSSLLQFFPGCRIDGRRKGVDLFKALSLAAPPQLICGSPGIRMIPFQGNGGIRCGIYPCQQYRDGLRRFPCPGFLGFGNFSAGLPWGGPVCVCSDSDRNS